MKENEKFSNWTELKAIPSIDWKLSTLFTELYHHLLPDIHPKLALNERHKNGKWKSQMNTWNLYCILALEQMPLLCVSDMRKTLCDGLSLLPLTNISWLLRLQFLVLLQTRNTFSFSQISAPLLFIKLTKRDSLTLFNA
jgi:hypothetical protein